VKKKILGVLLFIALGAWGGETDLSSRFEQCCPLEENPAQGTVARLVIPGDLFDQARHFPSDVRLLDEVGTQWPFFITTPVDRTVSKKRIPQRLNQVFVRGNVSYWEFDLLVPEEAHGFIHNGVEIQTSGRDFVRRVEISRVSDAGDSAQIASGYLIHFPDNRNARSSTISYPSSDTDRLHVRVYARAKNAKESFEIKCVSLLFTDHIIAERETVPATRCSVSGKETDERSQTFILDTGFKNRPVEFITFDVADPAYARSVSVWGRNAGNDAWRRVGGGEIHRLEDDTENTVRIRATDRWLRLEIRKNDDLPLDIQSIQLEALPRILVFEATSTRPARLCFRGWDVPAPAYDLKRRTSEATTRSCPRIGTGPMNLNAQGASPSFFRTHTRLWSAIAVGAVSLLTLWVIIRMMRRPA